MPLLSLGEFSKLSFEKGGRFLGCDLGEKTIGLALSDNQHKIASPLDVLMRTKWRKDREELLRIIQTHHIVAIIVGFPLNMDGSEGPRCQATREFVKNILSFHDLPICLWDERLSTVAATKALLEGDISRVQRKKIVDKIAASYILQIFLEAYQNTKK